VTSVTFAALGHIFVLVRAKSVQDSLVVPHIGRLTSYNVGSPNFGSGPPVGFRGCQLVVSEIACAIA